MEFLHNVELNIRAFFFNAKTDYLPYYKNFSFTISKSDQEQALKHILPMIKEQNPMFAYPEKDLLFRVNNLIVTGEEKLSEIIEELGTELTIEPALIFRSDNCLIINNDDFMHRYRSVFKHHYTDKEDLEYYTSLYPVHYASESFNYNHDYIGDAILITAARLIERHPEYKDEILQDINDEFNGIVCCEYENLVFKGKDYSNIIESLKQELNLKANLSLMDTIRSSCLRIIKKTKEVETLEGKNIALYAGYKMSENIIAKTNQEINSIGRLVTFSMSNRRAGQSLIKINPSLALQKAGKMLLDAFDQGAEVLLFSKEEDFLLFQSILAEVENAMGRDINLALLAPSKFQEMISRVEA